MIGAKTLKDYECSSMEGYFNMIVESIINGTRSQAKEQIKAMSKQQRKNFLYYLANNRR